MQKKILFIRFSSLGDVVLTESTIRLAKAYFPDYEIHYLTKPAFVDIIESFSDENQSLVDKIYLWKDKLNLIYSLNKEKYTAIIDLHCKFNTFLVKFFVKSEFTITYQKDHFLRILMIKKLTEKHIESVVHNYISTLEKLSKIKKIQSDFSLSQSLQDNICFPRLRANNKSLDEVKKIFSDYELTYCSDLNPADYSKKYLIAIFPGAQHKTKQFPIEKLAEFINTVPVYWNCSFIIMGDYKEKEYALKLRNLVEQRIYDLCGAFTIKQLIAAISMVHIVISNDSGPMHIAASLSKPQIAFYGATHSRLGFRPLNTKAVIIQKNIFCQPCSLHGGEECPKNNYYCMKLITNEEVFNVFKKLFEKEVLGV